MYNQIRGVQVEGPALLVFWRRLQKEGDERGSSPHVLLAHLAPSGHRVRQWVLAFFLSLLLDRLS